MGSTVMSRYVEVSFASVHTTQCHLLRVMVFPVSVVNTCSSNTFIGQPLRVAPTTVLDCFRINHTIQACITFAMGMECVFSFNLWVADLGSDCNDYRCSPLCPVTIYL